MGEGETPIENFQYSPWMPFGNLLKEENQFCEYRRGGAPSGNTKESRQRPKRIPHMVQTSRIRIQPSLLLKEIQRDGLPRYSGSTLGGKW